jgi:hypothetical protein
MIVVTRCVCLRRFGLRRCPSCRLARLPAPLETQPCLRCRTQLPASSSALCTGCRATHSFCLGCGVPFPTRPGVTRCFDCRPTTSNTVPAPTDFRDLFRTSFNPFVNSFQPSNPSPQQSRPPQSRLARRTQRTTQSHGSFFVISQGLDFLRQEHESRVHASHIFPPQISQSHIRFSVARF